MGLEATFGTGVDCHVQRVPVLGDSTACQSSTAVFVDWDRIDAMIENNGVDLGSYNGSSLWYMAESLGHTWQSMKRIRRTGSTTLKTLGRMADVLNVSPFDLLTVEPAKQ